MIKACKVPGCDSPYRGAKGYCSKHYQRMRLNGTTEAKERHYTCTIDGCNNEHYGLGFCHKHYIKETGLGKKMVAKWKLPAVSGEKKCSIPKCNLVHYAKNMCRRHWAMFRRRGSIEAAVHLCAAPGCRKNTLRKYCTKHKRQVGRGVPVNSPRGWAIRGNKNPRWNGGKSYYHNHSEFKRNRLIKLSQVNYTCEICGDYTNKCHHKDGSKTNHSTENLQALCRKHHGEAHRIVRANRPMKVTTSKYIRNYGATINVLADQLKISTTMVIYYHKKGILSSFLH